MNFLTHRAIVHKGEHRPYLFGVYLVLKHAHLMVCGIFAIKMSV